MFFLSVVSVVIIIVAVVVVNYFIPRERLGLQKLQRTVPLFGKSATSNQVSAHCLNFLFLKSLVA